MLNDFILLAQAADSTQFKFVGFLAVLILGIGLPIFLGQYIARRLRMADHGWRISLILSLIILAGVVVGRTYDPKTGQFNIKLGVDLKGGVILIYEVDQSATAAVADPDAPVGSDAAEGRVNMGALVEALARRINPSGTKEIVIRPYGAQQVEIIIPEVEQNEVDLIKKSISTAGVLEFRITANSRDHQHIIDLAREAALDPATKRSRYLRDESGSQVGLWARVGREVQEGGNGTFKLPVASSTLRDPSTGDLLEVPREHLGDDEKEFTRYIASLGLKDIDVLMATDDPYNVNGSHLGSVSRGNDERLRPCIQFNLKDSSGGVSRFAGLTTDYGPEGTFQRQLGILLDNTLLSAPNIQEPITQGRGRITGEFTVEEVEFMVNILEAGSLPVILNPIPISENQINPLLGLETIRQGKLAMTISMAVVLVFIVIYYRFAGLVASLALLLNLLFILAVMITIKAAFTLPGLAGLVLTIGMSVDANVLIFERIREELSRGAALRMAIRNGFGRAMSTIVDANVTTLITAFVLYSIGTDQIRGFAVTLILGIVMSMFTAIFCSRVVFDIAERTRWLTKLNMMQLLGSTQIDFIGKGKLAITGSLLLIALSLGGVAARGANIFDIDFRGGTSVQMRLLESMDTEEVRKRLAEQFSSTGTQFSVTAMNNTAGATKNDIFKVDSDLEEVEDLEKVIHDAFAGANGQSQLATYSLQFGPLKQVTVVAPVTESKPADESAVPAASSPVVPAAEPQPAAAPAADAPATPPATSEEAESDANSATSDADSGSTGCNEPVVTSADDVETVVVTQAEGETPAPAPAADTPTADTPTAEAPAAATPAPVAEVTTESDFDVPATQTSEATASDPGGAGEQPRQSTLIEVDVTFGYAINAQTLTGEIEDAATQLNIPLSPVELVNQDWDGSSGNAFPTWKLRFSTDEAQTQQLLDYLRAKFADTPVWPASNKIGGQVAGDMQQKAIAAFVASLFGIVIYIWIRFQRVVFGLAAVIALLHDLLVTLGAIALSTWLANGLGFLLISEFKISLPIVAALLTIVGYSLNDTIVVFDRIREVRGKSPDLTADMINRSINQTLSRTMLTSLTTLIVVIILYAIGGEGIHGFAYALVVGVTVGTYSSIFVASPALLWMMGASKKKSTSGLRPSSSKASASA